MTGYEFLSSYATNTNLALTGSTLSNNINSLSGLFTGYTGTLDATFASDIQLANTGSTLVNSISSLSGTLTSTYATINNLASTGSTLQSNINNLSGYINSSNSNILFTTGDQTISGFKTFNSGIFIPIQPSGSLNPVSLNITGTFNSRDTTFGAIRVNVVDINGNTNSNSRLIDLRAGSAGNVDRFWVNTVGGGYIAGTLTLGGGLGIGTNNSITFNPSTRLHADGSGDLSLRHSSHATQPFRIRVFNATGTNSGEFGLFGWQNSQLILGSQQSQNGILRDVVITGNNININGLGNFNVFDNTNIVGNLDVTGNILLSGNQVLTGVDLSSYATIANLASTGSTLQTNINNLSNTYATITNLASTGSTLNTKIDNLSGSSVLLYGNQSIDGVKTFRDNVYINNLFVTGTETIVSTNNFNVQSPYILLNLTGGAVDGGIFFVTGNGLTGINDTGPIIGFDHSTKFKFGISTRNSDLSTLPDIASVQDITDYSGFVNGKYATIINLASTGNTLDGKINSLSGNLTSTYATITNLASTGSTLNTKIDNLSGVSVMTFGDQIISGNKTFNNTITTRTISGLSGVGGSNNSISLKAIDNSFNIFSTNFAGGNIVLDAGSGNFAGGYIYLNGGKAGNTPYGGGVNINGNVSINSTTSQELSSRTINIFRTGLQFGNPTAINALTIDNNNISLNAPAAGAAGFGLLISGVLVTPALYATSANLASTGSTLVTNLASTGSTLNTRINNLSGYINSTSSNIVFTTGNQTISGTKTFIQDTTFGDSAQGDFLVISGNQFTIYGSGNFTSGLFVNGSPVLTGSSTLYATTVNLASTGSTLDTKINSLSGVSVLTFGNQTISGNKYFQSNETIFGNGDMGLVKITDDYLGSELGMITNSDEVIAVKMNDGSFQYGGGNPGNAPIIVNSTGNVGIGTNDPSEKLTVVGNVIANNLVYNTGNQTISGNKIFNSLRIEPSGRPFNIGTGLNINSESGIVRINTNVSSSLGAGFTYALTSGMDPNRPLDIEGRGRLVHGLNLDAGSSNFTNASDHFHLFFSAGPNNPGSFNGRYSTDTNTNYKSYQFSPTTRPNGNDNLRDLIHLTTLEAKGANDQTFPTSSLTELYLTTTGTAVVTPPGTGLVELAYAINNQPTSQYLHSTGDTVYLRVFPGAAGIVANTYNGTVVRRITGFDPAYGSTNVYKVGIALGALGINNNFNSAQRGTSTQTDSWTLSRSTPSNAFTGITRIERNSSQYLDQFNVFYTSPITGYTGETVVVDVFNRGAGTFIASGIGLTQARYDGYVSKVLSSTGLEITLSLMNFGSLGGVGRPGAFHNPSLTTGSAFISSEDLITGMKILRGSSDTVHRNYWAHNVFAGFRNLDATDLNVPAGVITRVAVGGLNRVESGSTSALGFNNKAYGFNSHAYGAHQENYNRDSVRIGATTESYINIASGRLGVNVLSPSATIDIGTGNIIAGNTLVSGGILTIDNINPVGSNSFIVKAGNGSNGLAFNPTAQGGAGLFGTNWISTIGMIHQGDYNLELMYGGGGTRSITFVKNVTRAILDSDGNFGIGSGITSALSRFYVSGNSLLQGDLTVSGNTTITGHLTAASKSFLINHPTQVGKKLQYGSLESPYHGIRLTDKNKISADTVKVYLPDYISSLVNDEKINIQLTNINHDKILFVKEVNVNENNFTIGMNRGWFDKNEYEFYWSFTAERKDIPKLTVEF